MLDSDACYRALRTRDPRFDGRFFTAVRSTGIYCRPICPARTPKRENCIFVPCAAAAQEAGYRPCLRCRPEASPGTPAWQGTSATVSRALQLIGTGALDHGSVSDLADRLGVGERHLRRLFAEHLGASPGAVAQTRRILFAKKLLDETPMPMTRLAHASGFASLRRFNEAIRRTYGVPPTELRRRAGNGSASTGSDLTLKLAYRAPFDWPALTSFLALRASRGVEAVIGDRYVRSFEIGGSHGIAEIAPVVGASQLRVRLRLAGNIPLIDVVERLRGLFDLTADPDAIARSLCADPRLKRSLDAHPGLRVPGAWDGFELAVRAILGQQVSVRGASTLSSRLVGRFGEPLAVDASDFATADDPIRAVFPRPEALAGNDLSSIGLPGARARAISGLAEAVCRDPSLLQPGRSLESCVARLIALPGIGSWTAQYIAMRALREPDAFPIGDLGLRRALSNGPGLIPDAELAEAAESWRPWRAYAAMALWNLPEAAPRPRARGARRSRP